MIKKIFLSLFLLAFITSCLLSPNDITNAYTSNPFDKPVLIPNENENINFILFTDVHINREKFEKNITHYYDSIYSDLSNNSYDFAVSLGDLSDNGEQSEEVFHFVKTITEKTKYKLMIQCVGNHDRKGSNSYATLLEKDQKTMCRYRCGNLSIYVLDNSTKTFTNKQFMWLEEALEKDDSKYKIFLAHENIAAGTNFSNTLVMSGFSDIHEMNKLFSLMDKYNVGLIFTGHTHSGNVIYTSPNRKYSEFNCISFVSTLNIFESGGYCYDVQINQTDGSVHINSYNAKNMEKKNTYIFSLPKSD